MVGARWNEFLERENRVVRVWDEVKSQDLNNCFFEDIINYIWRPVFYGYTGRQTQNDHMNCQILV